MNDENSYVAAFSGYLGTDEAAWKAYDATELMKTYSGPPIDILIDTGTADNFLKVITLLVFIRRVCAGMHAVYMQLHLLIKEL